MSDLHVIKAGLNIYQGVVETFDHNKKPKIEIYECYKACDVDAELERLNKINREMHDEVSKVRKEKHYLKLEIKALRNFIKDIEGTA